MKTFGKKVMVNQVDDQTYSIALKITEGMVISQRLNANEFAELTNTIKMMEKELQENE